MPWDLYAMYDGYGPGEGVRWAHETNLGSLPPPHAEIAEPEDEAPVILTAQRHTYAGMDFLSTTEMLMAQALDAAASLCPLVYFANAFGRFGRGDRVTRRPDFLVFSHSKLGVLEVDGPHHDPEADRVRDELFAAHDIPVMRVPAEECYEHPNRVAARFLLWLIKP